ncbi:putative TetR family transcriptional regulator [Oscillibacter valericigenes Sjm18-20]|nr:putative TetR family transcriptional regulator [Oscillibacter valericigenes Sjm18-20]
MDGKKTSRKMQAAATKEKIYDAALILFEKHGFESVSVDSIVEKAGVSKGGFYVHFASKDALMTEMINGYVGKLDLSYQSFMESFSDEVNACDAILALVDKIADTMEKIGYDLIKLAYRIHIDQNNRTDKLLSYDRDIYRIFNILIQRGIRQGELKDELSAEVVSDQFVTVLRGFTYEWCIRYPNFNLKGNLHIHFKLLLCGIKKQFKGNA